jgi:hypothetical protein
LERGDVGFLAAHTELRAALAFGGLFTLVTKHGLPPLFFVRLSLTIIAERYPTAMIRAV